MFYQLAHYIKDKCSFLWDAIEWGNAGVFSLQHKTDLQAVPKLLESLCNATFTIRPTEDSDDIKLEKFFAEQPESAFEYFKPHGFDKKSIQKILRNKAFQTFVVTEHDKIVGYFFLRSYINGKCFRGKIVDKDWQGRGIGKLMGIAMTSVAQYFGLRMFGSISPKNYASMASAKASNDIKIHKTLENGYFYIEFLQKGSE